MSTMKQEKQKRVIVHAKANCTKPALTAEHLQAPPETKKIPNKALYISHLSHLATTT